MKNVKLSENWYIDGLIDFEYKSYQLLSYLQKIHTLFAQKKIYPQLADLINHYRNLLQIKEQKESVRSKFPQSVADINFQRMEVIYEDLYKDDDLLKTIDEIIEFALPRFRQSIESGKELFEYAASMIDLEPIGIVPLYRKEGYFMLRDKSTDDILIFYYRIKLIQTDSDQFRALETKYLGRDKLSITNTPESIKMRLIRNFKEIPNPASYMISIKHSLPLSATWLPVAKRILLKAVS